MSAVFWELRRAAARLSVPPASSPVEPAHSISPLFGLTDCRCRDSRGQITAWKDDVKATEEHAEGRVTHLPITPPFSSSPSSLAFSVLGRKPGRSFGLFAKRECRDHLGPGSLPFWIFLGHKHLPHGCVAFTFVILVDVPFDWIHPHFQMLASKLVSSWGCYK